MMSKDPYDFGTPWIHRESPATIYELLTESLRKVAIRIDNLSQAISPTITDTNPEMVRYATRLPIHAVGYGFDQTEQSFRAGQLERAFNMAVTGAELSQALLAFYKKTTDPYEANEVRSAMDENMGFCENLLKDIKGFYEQTPDHARAAFFEESEFSLEALEELQQTLLLSRQGELYTHLSPEKEKGLLNNIFALNMNMALHAAEIAELQLEKVELHLARSYYIKDERKLGHLSIGPDEITKHFEAAKELLEESQHGVLRINAFSARFTQMMPNPQARQEKDVTELVYVRASTSLLASPLVLANG